MSPKRNKRTKEPKVPEKEIQEHAVRKKKPVQSFKTYIYSVLRQVHPTMGISSKAMDTMNSYMFDMFERIAAEVARLLIHSRRRTLKERDVEYAVKLLLPGELAKHAVSEGTKAVRKYTHSTLNMD